MAYNSLVCCWRRALTLLICTVSVCRHDELSQVQVGWTDQTLLKARAVSLVCAQVFSCWLYPVPYLDTKTLHHHHSTVTRGTFVAHMD